MKLLSSSSASTTTTSTSFDGNIQTPKSSAAGCISGMVRRLLCRNSLPTYPSDQLKVETQLRDVKLSCLKKENGVEASSAAAPGLVARLMGLESLPQVAVGGHEKSPNSISRSRSMNSVDELKEISSIQGKYRRVKSFREIPTFVQLEDEEFVILSFENEEKRRKLKQSKMEQSRIKSKRRRSIYEKNKENQEPNCNVSKENLSEKMITNSKRPSQRDCFDRKLKDSSNIPQSAENSCRNSLSGVEVAMSVKAPEVKKGENEMEIKRRIGKIREDDCLPVKRLEAECDSEYSSPNSVLDVSVFPCDSQINHSGESSRLENSKTRRTLTEELENYRKLSLVDTKSFDKQVSGERGKDVKFRRNYMYNHNFVKVWGEISKIVEKEVTESVWIYNRIQKLEDWKEEFSKEVELEIVDELLGVLVDELVEIHN